jgi:hypothetical protein
MSENALADIARLAERGDIVMREIAFRDEMYRHAVPNGQSAALCGFEPSSDWLDAVYYKGAGALTCQACHFQLQRAGYSVSFSGRITRVEQAS